MRVPHWMVVPVVLGLACGEPGADDAGGPAMDPAPALAAVTLDGDSVHLARLRGQVVLLNVWATWCVPCRREVPELQALHTAHSGRGLRVVGITVDSRGAEEQIRRFVDEFGMTYEVWWDPDQSVMQKLGAIGVPLTVVIDRQGRIAWRHLGVFEGGDPAMMEAIEEALAAEAAPGEV
jgi:peroxiredoxin